MALFSPLDEEEDGDLFSPLPKKKRRPLGEDIRLAGGMPTESAPRLAKDPGYGHMLGAAMVDAIGQPVAGLLERVGIAPEGTRQSLREMYEEDRDAFLENDPGATRASFGIGSEIGSSMIPLTPGGAAGRASVGLGRRLAPELAERSPRLLQGLAGATAGAAEGMGMGWASTAGMEGQDQLSGIALGGLLGGGAGALGGLSARRPEAAPPSRPRIDPDIAALQSAALGMDPELAVKRIEKRDANGELLGELLYTEHEGGIRIENVTSNQKGMGRALVQEAVAEAGPIVDHTIQTPEGQGFFGRMRETDPGLFADTGTDPIRKYMDSSVPPTPTAKEWLDDLGNRFYEEMVNKEQPIERLSPDLSLAVQRARGAEQLAKSPLFEGTFIHDPTTHETRMTGEALNEIVGGYSREDLDLLENFLAADQQIGLFERNERLKAAYAEEVAQRQAEQGAVRTGRQVARDTEAQYRRLRAEELRLARAEARAVGAHRVRAAAARQANRRSLDAMEAAGLAREDFERARAWQDVAASTAKRMTRQELRQAAREPVAGQVEGLTTGPGGRFAQSPGAVSDAVEAGRDFGRSAQRYGAATARESLATREAGTLEPIVERGQRETVLLGSEAQTMGRESRAAFDAVVRANRAQRDLERQNARRPRIRKPRLFDSSDPEMFAAATRDAEAQLGVIRARIGEEGLARVAETARRVRAWAWRANIEPLRAVGFFSDAELAHLAGVTPEQIAQMVPEQLAIAAADNMRYAPFMRVAKEKLDEADPTILAGSTRSDPIRKRTSGLSTAEGKKIVPPMESFVGQAQATQQWIARQQIRNAIADLADSDPAIHPEIRPANQRGGGPMVRRDRFVAYRNGEPVEYTAPPDVMRALETLTPRQTSLLWSAVTLPAKVLRTAATTTLEFIARNPMRDQWTAAVNSRYGYVPLWDMAKGWIAMGSSDGRLAEAYRRYLSSGAGMSNFVSLDRPHLQRTLADVARADSPLGKAQQFMVDWKKSRSLLYPLQAMSEVMESSSRVGEFMLAEQGGRKWNMWGEDRALAGQRASTAEAAAAARSVTLDFGRSGSAGQKLNSLIAFFNAEVQDADKLVRNLRQRPVATATKAFAYVGLPALANYYVNKDDPDYQARPQWEKMVFLHVHKREDGSYIKVPRPLGVINLLFGYGLQEALEAISGEDPDAVANLGHAITEQSPAHYFRHLADWAPTALRPGIELTTGEAGYDYFRDSPIVPRDEQELLPGAQGVGRLPPAANAIGGAMGVSPYKVRHAARGYLAGYGDYALQGLSAAGVGDPSIAAPPLPTTAADVPLVKAFVTRTIGFDSEPIADFYRRADEAAKAAETLKDLREQGRADAYARVLGENPMAMRIDDINNFRKRLGELRKEHNRVRLDPRISPEDRADTLLRLGQMATVDAATFNEELQQWLQQQP